MGTFSLLNPAIYIHDLDMTGFLHKVHLTPSVAELYVPTFGTSGWPGRTGGLRTVMMSAEGYWDSVPDAAIFSAIGVADRVATVTVDPGTETSTAWMFQGGRFGYDPLGANVGDAAPFAMASSNTGPAGLIRGQLAKAKGNVSATGQLGSILTMAGPTASQFLYATLHVFTAATTLTVQVQSAATLGFAGPTTRGTIGPITLTGGTWLVRVAGPITDGFYRLNVSVITGTFSVAGGIGIG